MITNIETITSWDKYRDSEGMINLLDAYLDITNGDTAAISIDYLKTIQQLRTIRSTQVAATAIATALILAGGSRLG